MCTQRLRIPRIFLSLFVLIMALGATGPQPRSVASVTNEYVPGEILVKFKSGVSPTLMATGVDLGAASLNILAAQYGITAAEPLFAGVSASSADLEQVYKLVLAPTVDVMAAAEKLSLDPNVVYAEPNYVLNVLQLPEPASSYEYLPSELTPIIADIRFRHEPLLEQLDIQDFLESRSSPLALLNLEQDDSFALASTPADVIQAIALKYEIAPQVLLVLIELYSGLIDSASPDAARIKQPMGLTPEVAYGFSSQVEWVAKYLDAAAPKYSAASVLSTQSVMLPGIGIRSVPTGNPTSAIRGLSTLINSMHENTASHLDNSRYAVAN
ncbi:MAG: hypothetical protein KatS3mg053_2539 [Candidatus Roseilinea sp.]|nr:MAG: hypothetical protein KatS3mg053_2539 [Candidatus Roseilinea sp.]